MSTTTATPGKTDAAQHVVPGWVLLTVFGLLLLLTLATVGAHDIDLGEWNVILALAIAVAKAGLVVMFFMHLRYDRPFYGLILLVAMMFVMLFIGLALLDTLHYQPDIETFQRQAEAGGQ